MLTERHSDRHHAILRILRGGVVRRQSELARLLREDGFDVTQSSVCRDLRELGVLKASGRYARHTASGGEYHRDPHQHRLGPGRGRRDRYRRVARSGRHDLGG